MGDSTGLHIHLFVRRPVGLVGCLDGVLQWENDQDSKSLPAEQNKNKMKKNAAHRLQNGKTLFLRKKPQSRTDSDSFGFDGRVKLCGSEKAETGSDDVTKQPEILQRRLSSEGF